MARGIRIGFNQGPLGVQLSAGKYGILIPQLATASTGTGGGGGSTGKIFKPGWITATSPQQANGFGGSPTNTTIALGKDSGTVNNPWPGAGTINYANGSIPGGHLGTAQSLNPASDGPTIMPTGLIKGGQLVSAILQRYPLAELQPNQGGALVLGRMAADLAQCTALGVGLIPIIMTRSFANNQVPYPAWMSQYAAPNTDGSGTPNGGYTMFRWSSAFQALQDVIFAGIATAFDGVPAFHGVCTQETSTSNTDLAPGSLYSPDNYLAGLKLEADSIAARFKSARHFAYHNFIPAGEVPQADWYMDQYVLYLQTKKYGAVVGNPDCVVGGSVTTRVYPRMHAYKFGGSVVRTLKNNTKLTTTFSSTNTGPIISALQNDEWAFTGHGAVPAATAVEDAAKYGLGITAGSALAGPATSGLDYIADDWHLTNGQPNSQKFNPDGVAMTKNHASPFPGTWVPPT